MSAYASPNPLAAAIVDPLYSQAAKSLQALGFEVVDDASIHWCDLLLTAKGVNWKDACNVIIFCLDQVQAAIEQGQNPPSDEALLARTKSNYPKIFQRHEDLIAGFQKIFREVNPPQASDELIATLAIRLIPEHIASHLPVHPLDEQQAAQVTVAFKLIRNFFSLIKKINDTLPEHFAEIFREIKTDCQAHAATFLELGHKNAIWIKMILQKVFSENFHEDVEHFDKICADPKRASDNYKAYKIIYLNEREEDFLAAKDRLELFFGLERHAQKKATELIIAAGEHGAAVFDFYQRNPSLQPMLEKIARTGGVPAAEMSLALKTFIEYQTAEPSNINTLLRTASDNSRLMLAILNPEFLEVLSNASPELTVRVTLFITDLKDPECYKTLIEVIVGEELDRAEVMLEAAAFCSNDHPKKVRALQVLKNLPLEDLPEVITIEALTNLLKPLPTQAKPTFSQASLSANKTPRYTFINQHLQATHDSFEKLSCGRAFFDLVMTHNETGLPVQTAASHLKEFGDHPLYQQFLNDPKLRKTYFQTILTNSEYLQEFNERLTLFRDSELNPRKAAANYHRWLVSKISESAELHSAAPEPEATGEVLSAYREPPIFQRILIIAPTERVALDLQKIVTSIPMLGESKIKIVDSERLGIVDETIKHLAKDRLVLYMRNSGKHSNFYALEARMNSLRGNLYTFGGKGDLYSLLDFFNSVLTKREEGLKLL